MCAENCLRLLEQTTTFHFKVVWATWQAFEARWDSKFFGPVVHWYLHEHPRHKPDMEVYSRKYIHLQCGSPPIAWLRYLQWLTDSFSWLFCTVRCGISSGIEFFLSITYDYMYSCFSYTWIEQPAYLPIHFGPSYILDQVWVSNKKIRLAGRPATLAKSFIIMSTNDHVTFVVYENVARPYLNTWPKGSFYRPFRLHIFSNIKFNHSVFNLYTWAINNIFSGWHFDQSAKSLLPLESQLELQVSLYCQCPLVHP